MWDENYTPAVVKSAVYNSLDFVQKNRNRVKLIILLL